MPVQRLDNAWKEKSEADFKLFFFIFYKRDEFIQWS